MYNVYLIIIMILGLIMYIFTTLEFPTYNIDIYIYIYIYRTRTQTHSVESRVQFPAGGVVFFATGPGWVLKCISF